ncbi:hypothetical protein AALT_g1023 [Alternaria alternata]|nr:hypothetical protein AALT_g1023 [Alternaria alternata]
MPRITALDITGFRDTSGLGRALGGHLQWVSGRACIAASPALPVRKGSAGETAAADIQSHAGTMEVGHVGLVVC